MPPINLHIYDVSTNASIPEVNKILQAVGTGAFHGGVEVYGKEWSFGYADQGTGVFCCDPKGCTAHHYRESVHIGTSSMSTGVVGTLLQSLMEDWQGQQYDLLRRNCVIFCDTFCKALGVGPIPMWVTNLAGAGATLEDGFKQAKSSAEQAAIIAAAKAGKINEKYQIQAKATQIATKSATEAAVLASRATTKAKELDQQYQLKEKAADAANKTAAKAAILAMQAATKASELDQQYRIKEQAFGLAAKAGTTASVWYAQAAAKASELDQKYKIKEQAGDLASKAGTAANAAVQQATSSAGSGQQRGPQVEDASSSKSGQCDMCTIL